MGDLTPLSVDHYLWLDNGYIPRSKPGCAGRTHSSTSASGSGEADPSPLQKFQDPVYKDSCVEFFVDTFPEKRLGYVNFETNNSGALLAAFGPDRDHRTPLWPEDLAGLNPIAGVENWPEVGDTWILEYKVPLSLFRKLYGDDIQPGHRARANFYKCGDETEVPHYGAWSPVGTPAPDFHRPEFFGEIVFG